MSSACSMYEGRAIRLLIKTPVGIVWAKKLATEAMARTAYLGSDIHEMLPSRRVTLLFNLEDEHQIASRLEPFITALRDKGLLMKAPHTVSVKSRSSECRECGSVLKPHSCPFISTTDFRVGGSSTGSARITGLSATAAVAAAMQQSGSMCRSWKTKKSCPRLEKNQPCKFDHPEAHIPPGCFDFARNGACGRGDACPYLHTMPIAAVARPEAASAAPPIIQAQPVRPVPASHRLVAPKQNALVEPQEEKERHVEPEASPSRSTKRRERTAPAQNSSDNVRMSNDDEEASNDAAVDGNPERTAKKKKVSTAPDSNISFALTPNRFSMMGASWADMNEEDDEQPPRKPPSRTPSKGHGAPASSLGSLSSPAPLTPSKGRQSSAAAAAAATSGTRNR